MNSSSENRQNGQQWGALALYFVVAFATCSIGMYIWYEGGHSKSLQDGGESDWEKFLRPTTVYFQEKQTSPVTAMMITNETVHHQYLFESLKLFCRNSDFPAQAVYLIQNGPINEKVAEVMQSFPQVKFMSTGLPMRKADLYDMLIQKVVKTPYFYITDDSWATVDRGQIAQSLEMMEKEPKLLQVYVWDGPARSHLLTGSQDPLVIDPEWAEGGFTFNPVLNRVADYKLLENGYVGSVIDATQDLNAWNAQKINAFYKEKGFYVKQTPGKISLRQLHG